MVLPSVRLVVEVTPVNVIHGVGYIIAEVEFGCRIEITKNFLDHRMYFRMSRMSFSTT